MNFWNIKKKTEAFPEITKEDKKDPFNKYKTGLPIDVIYTYLRKDHEAKGYEDALCNPDVSYKKEYLSLIRSNLEVIFKQARTKYNYELRTIDFHIKSLFDAGLIDTVERFKTKKTILEEHLQELDRMENDLFKGKDYMTGVFKSYSRGFLKGLVAGSMGNTKRIEEDELVD
jgi:DNA-binding transcriptional ArsR family regulator